MTDPSTLSASEAATRVASGQVSASTLAEAMLAHIAAREPVLRAFTHLEPALVMRQAATNQLPDLSYQGFNRLRLFAVTAGGRGLEVSRGWVGGVRGEGQGAWSGAGGWAGHWEGL